MKYEKVVLLALVGVNFVPQISSAVPIDVLLKKDGQKARYFVVDKINTKISEKLRRSQRYSLSDADKANIGQPVWIASKGLLDTNFVRIDKSGIVGSQQQEAGRARHPQSVKNAIVIYETIKSAGTSSVEGIRKSSHKIFSEAMSSNNSWEKLSATPTDLTSAADIVYVAAAALAKTDRNGQQGRPPIEDESEDEIAAGELEALRAALERRPISQKFLAGPEEANLKFPEPVIAKNPNPSRAGGKQKQQPTPKEIEQSLHDLIDGLRSDYKIFQEALSAIQVKTKKFKEVFNNHKSLLDSSLQEGYVQVGNGLFLASGVGRYGVSASVNAFYVALSLLKNPQIKIASPQLEFIPNSKIAPQVESPDKKVRTSSPQRAGKGSMFPYG